MISSILAQLIAFFCAIVDIMLVMVATVADVFDRRGKK